jgi:hypothetical protein
MLKWKSEHLDFVRNKFTAGYSATSVAIMFNQEFGTQINKAAVIGQLYRMHVRRGNSPTVSLKTTLVSPASVRRPRVPRPPKPLMDEPAPEHCCDLSELNNHRCHWPFGIDPPFRYCGTQTVYGSQYCEHHYQRIHYDQPLASRGLTK